MTNRKLKKAYIDSTLNATKGMIHLLEYQSANLEEALEDMFHAWVVHDSGDLEADDRNWYLSLYLCMREMITDLRHSGKAYDKLLHSEMAKSA